VRAKAEMSGSVALDAPGRTSWCRPEHRRFLLPAAVTLGVLALVALVHVPFPFGPDQGFAALVGNELRHGRVLYTEVWDVRQPGLYAFFTLGGVAPFGMTEGGVHLLEAVWFLGFALVLQRTLRPHVEREWVAAVSPLFVVGAYWAAADAHLLTQIEALVLFPLYVAIWGVAVDRPHELSTRRLVVTGVAGAAVVTLKLIYLPIFAIVWGIAFADAMRGRGWRIALRDMRRLLIGFAVPIAAVVVYLAAAGALPEALWTFFVFPFHQRRLDLRDWARLRSSLEYLVRNFAWTIPLALVAVALRRPVRDRLVLALLVWLFAGAALLLAQTWYPYQFQLLIAPLGVLAVFGFDRLVGPRRAPIAIAAIVVAALLALIPLRTLARKSVTFARDEFTLTAAGRKDYHDKYAPWYADAAGSGAFLDARDALPGPVHVFGNDEVQRQSGRRMAIAVNGLTPEQLDERLWRKTREQLAAAQPPYVFVSDFADGIMRERSPQTRSFLEQGYCELRRTTGGNDTEPGRWLVNRRAGRC
jgi:hypothetical protein